jgi:hypothetical protein
MNLMNLGVKHVIIKRHSPRSFHHSISPLIPSYCNVPNDPHWLFAAELIGSKALIEMFGLVRLSSEASASYGGRPPSAIGKAVDMSISVAFWRFDHPFSE